MREETQHVETSAQPAAPDAVAELTAILHSNDPQAVLFFGSKVQHRLSRISRKMLQTVAADNFAAAGLAVDEMLGALRQFDLGDADPNVAVPWWRRLWPASRPLNRLLRALAELRHRVDQAGLRLEREKTALLTEVVAMERLDAVCREHLGDLDRHVEVAKAVLKGGGGAGDAADLLQRVSDLSLSRQVGQQALASLLLVQQSGRELIARVNFVLTNTVPLWQQHMAQLVAIWRRRKAADTLAQARSVGEEMAAASTSLRAARERVRRQLSNGVYDLEAIGEANRQLLADLQEGKQLAERSRETQSRALAMLEAAGTEP